MDGIYLSGGLAFLLISVVNKEVTKPATSFLIGQDMYLHNRPFCHNCNI